MAAVQIKTKIQDDGMRYKSKKGGIQFGGSGMTMSCMKCGVHRNRSLLVPFKLAGAVHYRCNPTCIKAS